MVSYLGEDISTRYLRNSLDILARKFLAENQDFPESLQLISQGPITPILTFEFDLTTRYSLKTDNFRF